MPENKPTAAEMAADLRKHSEWTSSPQMALKLAEALEENARLKEQVRESQVVMQQFAHIYPDGFPGDWKPQPEHLASQVTFLCNHQQAGFQQLLDVIKRLEKAEALLKETLRCAVPHPQEHPAMWAMWNKIKAYFSDHQRICEDNVKP